MPDDTKRETGDFWSPFTDPTAPHDANPTTRDHDRSGRSVGDDVVEELEEDEHEDEPEKPDDSEEEKKRKQEAAQRKRKRTLAKKKRDAEKADASDAFRSRVGNLADGSGPNLEPGQDTAHPETMPADPPMIGGVPQSDAKTHLLPISEAPESKPTFEPLSPPDRIVVQETDRKTTKK